MDYCPVTVCVPTLRGRDDLLERALASVRAQTLQPQECIIRIDTDRRGAAWTRNQLLEQVKTPFVAWLDDDDELLPNHLQVLYDTLAGVGGGAILAYPCMEVVGGRDPLATIQHGQIVHPCGVQFGRDQASWLLERGNFIPITYLARTSALVAAGGFPPSGGPGREEDYQLLCNLLRLPSRSLEEAARRFVHVPTVTWRYHIHDRNTGGGWDGTGASNKAAFRR